MDATTVIILLFASIPLIFLYFKRRYSYWARNNVAFIEPQFFYGNGQKILKSEISYAEQFLDFYRHFKARGDKHGGVYFLFSPVYVPIDPELISNILQKDFDHFVNRGMYVDEESNPLSGHLFNLEGAKWKNLRAKLTPTFTSGKMRMMFKTLVACCNGLEQMLKECTKEEAPVEVREVIARFTTDIIGSCAFGIECNSMKDPDAEFRKYGKRIFEISTFNKLKQIVAVFTPKFLLKKIGVSFTDKEVESFFINAVREIIDYREKNKVTRNDFLQLLIDLRKTDSTGNEDPTQKPNLTLNEVAAQCFVFFGAGFETSSTTTMFALYELSVNEEIQERLREEVLSVLGKYDGQITYESFPEMTYLEKVINETLRKYPPVSVLHRVPNKRYPVPDTSTVLQPEVSVQIPVIGLHYDEEYYPDPQVFDPERFNEENKTKRPACTFLPFGDGPRNCIGLRFGKIQTKLALITILKQYKLFLNEKTKTPITFDKVAFILGVEGGVWLDLSPL